MFNMTTNESSSSSSSSSYANFTKVEQPSGPPPNIPSDRGVEPQLQKPGESGLQKQLKICNFRKS